MNTTTQQIEDFRSFALRHLAQGGTDWTIDELYDRWRLECPSEQELRADALAVERSLQDMKDGETGRSFKEFAREFRQRHGLDDAE